MAKVSTSKHTPHMTFGKYVITYGVLYCLAVGAANLCQHTLYDMTTFELATVCGTYFLALCKAKEIPTWSKELLKSAMNSRG